jgi:hypothetical protein
LKAPGFQPLELMTCDILVFLSLPCNATCVPLRVGYDNHLLIVDGDYIPEPDFNLNRIVEHSVVRSKDTLTYVTLAPEMGAEVSDHVVGLVGYHLSPRYFAVKTPIQSMAASMAAGKHMLGSSRRCASWSLCNQSDTQE